MLLDSIKKDLQIAMKAKETLKISTLRMITSSIKNIEINNRTSSKDESSNESLSDSEIIQLLSICLSNFSHKKHNVKKFVFCLYLFKF